MELTPEQRKKLEKLAKVVKSGNLGVLELLVELEDHIDEKTEEMKQAIPDVALMLETLKDNLKGEPGDPGADADHDAIIEEVLKRLPPPEKGKDADEEAIVRRVVSQIKIPQDGKDAEVDYDRIVSEVMEQITLPEDGKDGSPDTADDIRNKLELLAGDDRLDVSAIRGLETREQGIIDRAIEILDRRTQYLINKQSSGTGGATAFTQLSDVPNSYTGHAGQATRVNAGETGLEFFTAAGSGTVTSVASADGSVTVANPTTTVDLTVVKAPKLSTARTIDGVSFDGTANVTIVAPATHAATSKATPVDADELPLSDSAASFVLKKLTWANVKATLKTYFDGIYAATAAALALGSVPFADGSGKLAQDNTNFFFDNTSKQLRLGLTGAPFGADPRVRIAAVGNVNDYSDVAAQNQSTGDSATTDFFTSADNDSSTLIGHYTDFGITGSGWNPSTAGNIKTVSINTAGTGYSVNDVLTISTGGDGNATVTVTSIGGGGAVTGVLLTNNGTGYVTGSGDSTTGGGGSGFKVNVLSIIDFTLWGANDGYLLNSGANLNISTDTSGKVIKMSVGGIGATNEVARFTATGMTLGLAGTLLGKLALAGNTSGTTILQALAAASGTLTLPSATDTLVARATTDTLTNKRNQPRTSSSTTASTLTPDLSVANVFYRTTQTATLTINAPTGTPVIGETIAIYVDAAGSQALVVDAAFVAMGTGFPGLLTAGKTFMLTAQYNGTNWKSLWANAV